MNRLGDSETSAEHVLHVLEKVVVRTEEQRVAPERLVSSADEEIAEGHAGESRAERQHCERDQHHQRRFMRGVIAVAMIPVTMSAMRASGRLAAQSPRLPKKVMNIRRQE